MATRARAARLLTLDAAAAFDRGERCDMEAGMAKYFASEAALENSIESMRIHGAYGYSKEYDIERLYRDAPLTVHRRGHERDPAHIIAKQWLKRNARRMKPLEGLRILSVESSAPARTARSSSPRSAPRSSRSRTPRRAATRRATSARIMLGEADSQYFQGWNTNKKSVALDLKTRGRAARLRASS